MTREKCKIIIINYVKSYRRFTRMGVILPTKIILSNKKNVITHKLYGFIFFFFFNGEQYFIRNPEQIRYVNILFSELIC